MDQNNFTPRIHSCYKSDTTMVVHESLLVDFWTIDHPIIFGSKKVIESIFAPKFCWSEDSAFWYLWYLLLLLNYHNFAFDTVQPNYNWPMAIISCILLCGERKRWCEVKKSIHKYHYLWNFLVAFMIFSLLFIPQFFFFLCSPSFLPVFMYMCVSKWVWVWRISISISIYYYEI